MQPARSFPRLFGPDAQACIGAHWPAEIAPRCASSFGIPPTQRLSSALMVRTQSRRAPYYSGWRRPPLCLQWVRHGRLDGGVRRLSGREQSARSGEGADRAEGVGVGHLRVLPGRKSDRHLTDSGLWCEPASCAIACRSGLKAPSGCRRHSSAGTWDGLPGIRLLLIPYITSHCRAGSSYCREKSRDDRANWRYILVMADSGLGHFEFLFWAKWADFTELPFEGCSCRNAASI